MSYSRNFGFRGFENIVRNGRHKTPTTGDRLLLGSPVKVDSNGVLAQVSAEEAPGALKGILVYEHIQFQGVDTELVTNHDKPFDSAPKGVYAQMVSGKGVKVWFRTQGDKTLYDGRTQENDPLLSTAGLAVGDQLVPGAGGTWVEAATASNGWLTVESVDATRGLVEARVNF